MTTLKDIDILRKAADESEERYNRRCRRLVALYMAGRKVEDHIILLRTDERRLGFESTRRDLENVIEIQAMAASM